MKSLFVFFFILIFQINTFAIVTINIKVHNPVQNQSIRIINDFYTLDMTPFTTSRINDEGTCAIQIDINQERFMIVDIGEKRVRLLVKPEKKYLIEFDTKMPKNIYFGGYDSKINSFIEETNTLFWTFTFNNKTYIEWETFKEFPDGLLALEQKVMRNFDDFCLNSKITNLDANLLRDYLKLEILEIKLNRHISIFNFFNESNSQSIPAFYKNIEKELVFDDSFFGKSFYSYQTVLYFYSIYEISKYLTQEYKNFENFKVLFPNDFEIRLKTEVINTISNLKIPKISKSYVYANELINTNNQLNYLEDQFSRFNKKFPNSQFSKYVEKKINKVRDIEFGISFPSLNGYDIEGNPIDISKSKYIYIDIWATWCGPCIKEIPASYKIQKYFEGRNDLLFLNVSIDADPTKWKLFIARTPHFLGKHINLNENESSTLMETLGIKGIPRYIIVSKNGKIINPNAPHPSDPKLIEVLDKLLIE